MTKKEEVLARALREVRDINKNRNGLFCSKTQSICREALKAYAQAPANGE